MSAKQKNKRSKIITGAFVLILCALWLLFAVCYWNRVYPFYRAADFTYLRTIEAILDPGYFPAVSVYLHLAPFLLFVHLITRLIPQAIRTSLQNKNTARLYAWSAGLCVFGAIVLMCGCVTYIPEWLMSQYPSLNFSRFVQVCDLVYPLLTPLSLLCAVCVTLIADFKEKKKSSFSLFLIRLAVCILAGVLAAAASACLLAVLKAYLPEAVIMVENFCQTLAASSSMCAVALILAPLIEETAFRGLIQHHLSKYLNPFIAVIISSLMFGLWHRNASQFVYTFLFGLIAGSIFHITGKIRWSILTHFILNLSAVLAFSTSEMCIFGTIPYLHQAYQILSGLSVLNASVLCGALICILILLIRFLTKRH